MEGACCSRTVTGCPSYAGGNCTSGRGDVAGAEEERIIDQWPERPLSTHAHMRRDGRVLQRRGAEEERRVGWMEGKRCFRAVTGMPVFHRP